MSDGQMFRQFSKFLMAPEDLFYFWYFLFKLNWLIQIQRTPNQGKFFDDLVTKYRVAVRKLQGVEPSQAKKKKRGTKLSPRMCCLSQKWKMTKMFRFVGNQEFKNWGSTIVVVFQVVVAVAESLEQGTESLQNVYKLTSVHRIGPSNDKLGKLKFLDLIDN